MSVVVFDLLRAPPVDGYGDGLLPLELCKAHLHVTHDDEDDLIAVLRDAAIEFIERHCSTRLAPSAGMEWTGQRFPAGCGALRLGVRPVIEVTAISWADGAGVAVPGVLADFRVSGRGDIRPAIGNAWPSDVGGDVVIEFTAGHPAGAPPPLLLQAALLMLGHFYLNREAIIVGTSVDEMPLGVARLCAPFVQVLI